jgi:hypothetical protein
MTQPVPVHTIFNFTEWLKAFGWGFISFPIFVYIVRTFGKQIWSDLSTLWSKWTTKADTAVQAEAAKVL